MRAILLITDYVDALSCIMATHFSCTCLISGCYSSNQWGDKYLVYHHSINCHCSNASKVWQRLRQATLLQGDPDYYDTTS